jgi:hypothetical protein
MSPLDSIPKLFDTEAALRAETNAVHPGKLPVGDNVAGEDLYAALHDRRSTALCLSGGGIRSASFALGVIEALAVHPRPASNQQAPSEDQSLLSQFNYLSTVSGGGYIGSWLSAYIARASFPEVWKTLVGFRPHADEEPAEISWLRSYSNYLTPRTGLFSADTWAAISLYVRNLMLNWLVILPALCLGLFAVKVGAVVAFWGSFLRLDFPRFFIGAGVIAMVIALRFALLNRPSRDPGTIASGASEAYGRHNHSAGMRDPHHNETARTRSGADEAKFIKRCLIPAVLAAFLLSIYLLMRGPKLAEWSLFKAAAVSLVAGMGIYALAWVSAWPPKTWVPYRDPESGRIETRSGLYWARDFISWAAAGGVYGAIIGVGIHIIARSAETDATGHSWVWLLIGNANVDYATAVFLLAFIYGVPWIIMAQLIAEMIFVGLTSWQTFSDSDREWFGRSTGWFGVFAFGWFIATFLVLVAGEFVLWLVGEYNSAKYSSAILAAASGVLSTVLGKSARTASEADAKSPSWTKWVLPLAAILFLVFLVIGISVVMDHLMFERGLVYSSLMTIDTTLMPLNQRLAAEGKATLDRWEDVQWLIIGLIAVSVVAFFAWRGVNINRFSAHSVYRNRLIRGFLGASNPKRAPNPFTGFDEADNIRMHRLWTADKKGWQPFHVVNIALNIVNSKRLAWQERKAESFVATPLHCGSATSGLGFRETKEYADKEGGGLSLGTALAISGAAASPNMGYNSSPLVTLMLALFNVRLGWWLGNPGPHGDKTYGEQGPSNAIRPFIMEMFGLTTDDGDYVYLSDGGHFENLALYEMIRRRCRCIVLSDAGCDPEFSFDDLGNAVRKISIDLGVYINFGELRALRRRSKDNSVIEGAYYAIGEIDYQTAPGGDQNSANGYILYIKPGYHGTESAGVVAYATANAAFPHESTGDQFFSESQFESYHTLGFEIMDSVLKRGLERVAQKRPAEMKDRPPTICEIIEALARPADDEKPPRLADALKFLDKDDLAATRKLIVRLSE